MGELDTILDYNILISRICLSGLHKKTVDWEKAYEDSICKGRR